VFDWAVHGGVGRAVRDLQTVLDVTVDGAIGRQTLDAARRADPAQVIRALCERRLNHLRSRPHWDAFGRGWSRRVREIEEAALARAERPALTVAEAQKTSTVQTATGIAAAVAPAAAALSSVIDALSGLDRWVSLGLIAAGLVALVVAAWMATTWLRMRHA
jgi:lysozyme family protein